MAVNLRDTRSGFRHSEVVMFINEEVLSNGGDLDFYESYRTCPWSYVEDRLWAFVSDPEVPRAVKRACTWSALALSVRVGARKRAQQARRVRRLQEQVAQRQTATWALASELQRLQEECEEMALQLGYKEDDLQQSLQEREVLRRQLLQAQRSTQFNPQPQDVDRGWRAQQQWAQAWPQRAEEQGKAAAAGAKGRRDAEAQEEEAWAGAKAGSLCMPGSPSPWAQVVQPLRPMPHSHPFPYHTPFLMAFQYTLSPPPTVAEAAAAVPSQMPRGRIYTPGQRAAVASQEELAPLWNQGSQGEEEGAVSHEEIDTLVDSGSHCQKKPIVRPKFINPYGHSWRQGDSRKQPQEQKTWPPKGKKAFEFQPTGEVCPRPQAERLQWSMAQSAMNFSRYLDS